MQTQDAITASAVLGEHRFRGPAERYAFVERLERGLARLPGVSSVAVADALPPLTAGAPFMYSSIAVDGRRVPGQAPGGMVNERHITPGYFRTLGIQILRGRSFNTAEMNTPEGRAILSKRLSDRLFGDVNPLGHTIQPAGWPKTYTIVGVAANVKNAGLTMEDAPELYLPFDNTQGVSRFVSAVVKSSASSDLTAQLITGEIHSIDPTLPVTVQPFEQRIAKLNERPRFNTLLLSLFASIGVLLAALGIYGVLAFLVSQRVREIGVRMALGATPARIAAGILAYAMSWTAMGLVLGAAGAFFISQRLQPMLYAVTPADPWTFAGVVFLFAAVAALAAYIPSVRAARLDPAATLRQE